MSKTLAKLLSEHPQFKFEPGMLVLFHNSLKDSIKLRLRSSENAYLWKVADDAMEPVLNDYGTAGVLLEVLTGLVGDYGFEVHRRSDYVKKCWAIKIRVHNLYQEGGCLGEALTATLLRLWDEKKLGVPNVF